MCRRKSSKKRLEELLWGGRLSTQKADKVLSLTPGLRVSYIPSVYDGLDPDVEMLLRFNNHRARRQEKRKADKRRRSRSKQQERVFAVWAQDALALAPVTERATANLAFVTLTIGRAEGRQAELDCMVDSGAQVSLGNMRHMLKLALQHSQAVRLTT